MLFGDNFVLKHIKQFSTFLTICDRYFYSLETTVFFPKSLPNSVSKPAFNFNTS